MEFPPKSAPIPVPKVKCEGGECQCNNQKFHDWREKWARDFRAKIEADRQRKLKRKATEEPE